MTTGGCRRAWPQQQAAQIDSSTEPVGGRDEACRAYGVVSLPVSRPWEVGVGGVDSMIGSSGVGGGDAGSVDDFVESSGSAVGGSAG